jgi:hypothetical protein
VGTKRQNDQRLFLKNELQPLEAEKARLSNELLVGFLIKRISLSSRSPAKTVDYKWFWFVLLGFPTEPFHYVLSKANLALKISIFEIAAEKLLKM